MIPFLLFFVICITITKCNIFTTSCSSFNGWETIGSSSISCGNWDDDDCLNYECRLGGSATMTRKINDRYADLILSFSLDQSGLDSSNNERCNIEYSYNNIDWINIDSLRMDGNYQYNLPDLNGLMSIKLSNNASSSSEYCRFDNINLSGKNIEYCDGYNGIYSDGNGNCIFNNIGDDTILICSNTVNTCDIDCGNCDNNDIYSSARITQIDCNTILGCENMNIFCGNNINIPQTHVLNNTHESNIITAEQCTFDCGSRFCSNIEMNCNSNICNINKGLTPNTVIMNTPNPTISPTNNPTITPSITPTVQPSISPTKEPSNTPTLSPTMNPTETPSIVPTYSPSISPSISPSEKPSLTPSNVPTIYLTISEPKLPTYNPTITGTNVPTLTPNNVAIVSPNENSDTFMDYYIQYLIIGIAIGLVIVWITMYLILRKKRKLIKEMDKMEKYQTDTMNSLKRVAIDRVKSQSVGSPISSNDYGSKAIYFDDNNIIKTSNVTKGYGTNNDYKKWTKNEFIDWIAQLNNGKMIKYKDILLNTFTKYNITGNNIVSIRRQDWMDIFGINNFDDMNIIHKSIEELKTNINNIRSNSVAGSVIEGIFIYIYIKSACVSI